MYTQKNSHCKNNIYQKEFILILSILQNKIVKLDRKKCDFFIFDIKKFKIGHIQNSKQKIEYFFIKQIFAVKVHP